ncbi:MAG: CinA family protein [Candidatus Omnitrophica bacterium]|nr:CinA family protein [Candidatus Omnitrophota bacterium]
MKLEEKIGKILKEKKLTLALAESCTGGLVSKKITDISGSSDYFLGSVIAYSNKIKVALLKVSPKLLKKNGAVSPETAKAMACGAKRLLKTDVAVSITGIAGPAGGSKEKPVGLAYIAFLSGKRSKVEKVFFKGTRRRNREKFAIEVLRVIIENI